jgi:hypothetical protein
MSSYEQSALRLGEALEIGNHGAKRYQIFEPTARRADSATRGEHRIELNATGLVDTQRVAIDLFARPSISLASAR